MTTRSSRSHRVPPFHTITHFQRGWHIWHNNSFSPFCRAQQDHQQLGRCSDFLKTVINHARAVAGAAATRTQIWPGIDIDIPTALGTKDAVLAALKAGPNGLLLSRKYSEIRLANLADAS